MNKIKIDNLFYSIWNQRYNELRNALRKKSDIGLSDFAHMGILFKRDYLEIDESILQLLSKKAEQFSINISTGREDKLTHWYEKGYFVIGIEELPVKTREQFLLAKALFVLSELDKKYIQTVYDYFQKNGEWPLIREISREMDWEDIPAIMERLSNSMQRKNHSGEICQLSLYGILHAKNSNMYKDAVTYIARTIRKAIEEKPKEEKISFKDIPGFVYANSNHKKTIFFLLGEPFGGCSYSVDGLIIDAPKNPKDIINFTDPILFVRSYYIRWEHQYETGLIPISIADAKREEDDKLLFMRSKKRREIAFEYFKGAEIAFANNASTSAVILYGATLECILFDLLMNNRKKVEDKTRKKVEEMKFEDMINAAHTMRYITQSSKDFGHSLRHYRNLIHPARCSEEKIPTPTVAEAARHVFHVIVEELQQKRKK